ncbi:MAG: sterol desaturase family protein [Gammaproteobacteria bacterium]
MTVLLLIFFAMFAVFALLELLRPRQGYPNARFWRLRGALAFVAYLGVATFSPLLWDAFLGGHRLFDLSGLPLWAQIAIGFGAAELVGYTWHRTMHATPFLWRWFHQMHHSAERMDVWGAFWFSPLDTVGFTFAGSLALVGIAGVTAPAAIVINIAMMFLSMWTHANIKTPHWLGYIVARPESHSAHHARGVHRYNYCDVPLIDMLFGTFRNPRTLIAEAGFYDGASLKVGQMLLGRDIYDYGRDDEEAGAPGATA